MGFGSILVTFDDLSVPKKRDERGPIFQANLRTYCRTVWSAAIKLVMLARVESGWFWASITPPSSGDRAPAHPNFWVLWTLITLPQDDQIPHSKPSRGPLTLHILVGERGQSHAPQLKCQGLSSPIFLRDIIYVNTGWPRGTKLRTVIHLFWLSDMLPQLNRRASASPILGPEAYAHVEQPNFARCRTTWRVTFAGSTALLSCDWFRLPTLRSWHKATGPSSSRNAQNR